MKRGTLLFSFLFLQSVYSLEIAFFVKRDPQGNIEVYERGSPYSHVAMKVGDQWLNAHPWRGIELTNDLMGMGDMVEIFSDHDVPEPGQDFLDSVLGRKFFIFADWNDPEHFYCSKIVAKYLNLEPEPMVIDEVIWQGRFQEYNGRPGVSPATLHRQLIEAHYTVRTKKGAACWLRLQLGT